MDAISGELIQVGKVSMIIALHEISRKNRYPQKNELLFTVFSTRSRFREQTAIGMWGNSADSWHPVLAGTNQLKGEQR